MSKSTTTLFTCDWCDKSYRTRSKWITHRRTHTGERPYICSYPCCGKSYTRSDHLRRHEWSHQERKPFVCSRVNCGKTFATKQRLQRHEWSHISKRMFTCSFPDCGKAFRKKKKLTEHFSSHQPKCSHGNSEVESSDNSSLQESFQVPEHWSCFSYFCSVPECSKGFYSFSELSSHFHKVHGTVLFTCNYCAKSFSKYSYWLRHLSTHEEDVQVRQVFPCHFPNCVKKFTSFYNRLVHERSVHEKQYLFECPMCYRKFNLESSLRRHLRKLHKDMSTKVNKKKQKHVIIESVLQTNVESEITHSNILRALCGDS